MGKLPIRFRHYKFQKQHYDKPNDKPYAINVNHNTDIFRTIGEKDEILYDRFNWCWPMHKLYFEMLDNFAEYNIDLHRFIKGKKKIETRERLDKLNEAKSDFMASVNVCEDVKHHIFSFL